MPRAPKQKVAKQEFLRLENKEIRFATPEQVANYRAKRLSCNKLLEIGSGIGAQTILFAKECKEVLSIEKNPETAKLARANLKELNINNVKIIIGDALDKSVISLAKEFKPDIVFCDTERAESGVRTIENIKPNVIKLLEIYSNITPKIAIELPPFIQDLNKIKISLEREFISLNKKLNRLTLYFNDLKNHDTSVVLLPENKIFKHNIKDNLSSKSKLLISNSIKDFSYLYIINPAIILAGKGIYEKLANNLKCGIILLSNKPYFLSNNKVNSPFLEQYKILLTCENKFETIIENLNKLEARKVVIRYPIDAKEYWNERKKYEHELKGDKEFHIFKNDKNKEAIICEKLEQKEKIK